jgi:hypothetical protein
MVQGNLNNISKAHLGTMIRSHGLFIKTAQDKSSSQLLITEDNQNTILHKEMINENGF